MSLTTAIAGGTAVIGAFSTGGAQYFRHGGIRVDASNSHSDFFIKNLLAIERRSEATWRCTGWLHAVTGLN